MSSQVFYRKWRPQTLSEVVGQPHVTETLRHAVQSGRVAHAYLFCGPRGTGKTSTGRILAKAVNCLNPVNGEPCNACEMCKSFDGGTALDIIEVDAASNRGIDEIRDLKEKVNYAPNIGKRKVYIIDEVHMITKEGFNAFLKTLEEPPAHVIFVLATTDPHKVLPTILSRCQRFDFHRLSQSAVISKLEFVAGKENIKIDPEALRLVARVTTGSLRDAENMLEQLVAYYGHAISLSQTQSMLGITNDPRSIELIKHVINKNISGGINTINAVSGDGLDLQQFNRELISHLRNLLLTKSGSIEVIDVSEEEMSELKKMAEGVNLGYLLNAIKSFGQADFRQSNYSPLPLELAFIGAVLFENKDNETKTRQTVTQAPAPAVVVEKNVKHTKAELKTPPKPAEAKPEVEHIEEETKNAKEESDVKADKAEIQETEDVPEMQQIRNHWKDFINALRGEGSSGNLDAFLRSACEPVNLENDVLVVGFYHKFHKDYIEDPKYKFLVEKKLRDVFNKPYRLRCIVIEGKKAPPVKKEKESSLAKLAIERGARIIDKKPNVEET